MTVQELTQGEVAEIQKQELVAYSFTGEQWQEIKSKVFKCVASGDTRYALNGVYFFVKDNKTCFVGSDTHRLSYYESEVYHREDAPGVILPADMFKLITKTGRISFAIQDDTALVCYARNGKSASKNVTVKLVDGTFPASWNKVFPDSNISSLPITRKEKAELSEALKVAGNVNNNGFCHLTIDGNELTLTAATDNYIGTFVYKMTLEESYAQGFKMGFTAQYLAHMLDNANHQWLEYVDADTPIRMKDNNGYIILMPVKRR